MHREACVVVNGMSLTGRRGQTKTTAQGSLLPHSKHTPPTTKPGVCHHFTECGINSLVARMPIAQPGQKKKEQRKKRASVNP